MDGAFTRKNWRSFDPKARAFAQVNHYAVRDLASFLLKHSRGSANAPHRNVGDAYWVQHDRNEEEDLILAERAPKLWDEMRALDEKSDGQLLRLRNRAFRQWRIALEGLLERPDLAALRNSILASNKDVEDRTSMVEPFRLPGPQPVFTSVRGEAAVDLEETERKVAVG